MDLKQIVTIINQIAKERGVDPSRVLEGVEDSIATAYRKEYGERGEVIKAKIDSKTGEVKFWKEKEVVDETTVRIVEEEEEPGSVEAEVEKIGDKAKDAALSEAEEDGEGKLPRYNPERHILIDEAKKIKNDAILGEVLEFPLEAKLEFGRIAAQSAKQVILQKFREAEKEAVFGEFKNKEGQIISGLIHRYDRGNIHVDLGRISGIMFANETIPGEHYGVNQRMRFYVLAIQENRRGQPEIVLSRSHPKFIARLFELEVPEIADGTVEIKAISREAGNRTKIAVYSDMEGVDPIGSCVGQRGTRVMAVTNELGNEKIDIVEWSENPEEFISASLSPAKVKEVEVFPKHEAKVIVPDDQLSLAIGKGGQNVRLAAKLTGWKIDVRSEMNPDEVQEDGIAGTLEKPEGEVSDKPEEGVLIPKKEEE
ncbi:MAG: transcription termination factor NusA [Candidatus Colwellbacteria bacterium]|jgi:N utilization substance protein A|nr:transcription termination factor NusA [Candidatus Colwellbacteria bacterium]MCK9497725.1 transcription termination factor NusA [Candidatus Colwellbacteria bacterium]MDD3752650.1 transcription termination factor NusA [Candidatus Colwellbacteria bacterium]MDD4818964.1 transcription termination factor NusA [Candidatus Colwellbacteria bacterium]